MIFLQNIYILFGDVYIGNYSFVTNSSQFIVFFCFKMQGTSTFR
jgi:hypothetical protein